MNFDFEKIKANKNYYKEAWKNMPEFEQKSQKVFKELIIKFPTEKDFDDFNKKLNTNISLNNKSYWYPQIPVHSRDIEYGWVEDDSAK